MEIRQINKSVEELIQGAEYLGSGASKEAYLKNGIVYKIPRGRYLIQNLGGIETCFPNSIEEVNQFLYQIYDEIPQLVWPLGQFATELIIWEALKELESEGLDIGCFTRIKDYYFDKNGVIVIEQECANDEEKYEVMDEAYKEMEAEIHLLRPILEERFNIELRDIREGNCGMSNGKMKLFDFGLSTSTNIFNYGSYSEENNDYSESDCYGEWHLTSDTNTDYSSSQDCSC